jgi:hypothetical protein
MTTRKIATIAAASTIALLALGGTALAAGADDTTAPRTPSATSAPSTSAPSTSGATSAPATPSAGLEWEVEHGRVVLKPHGGATSSPSPQAGAGLEREVEHGRVVLKPHGGARAAAGHDDDGHNGGDDHGRDRGHGSDD